MAERRASVIAASPACLAKTRAGNPQTAGADSSLSCNDFRSGSICCSLDRTLSQISRTLHSWIVSRLGLGFGCREATTDAEPCCGHVFLAASALPGGICAHNYPSVTPTGVPTTYHLP